MAQRKDRKSKVYKNVQWTQVVSEDAVILHE